MIDPDGAFPVLVTASPTDAPPWPGTIVLTNDSGAEMRANGYSVEPAKYAIAAKFRIAGVQYGDAGDIPYRSDGGPAAEQVRGWLKLQAEHNPDWPAGNLGSEIVVVGLIDLDPPVREGDPLAPLPDVDGLPVFPDPGAIERRIGR